MRVRGYAAGTPCWAAVTSPDPEATRAFYGALFGWGLVDGKFTLDGRAVAGMRAAGTRTDGTHTDGTHTAGTRTAGMRTQSSGFAAWLISISTDDSQAVAQAVERAGGRVRMAPTADAEGTSAVFTDPAGATFATWQRGSFFGAQVSFEPGATCWYELAAHDLSVPDDFYSEVFGWRVLEAQSAPGDPYFEFHHYGDTVAGLVPVDHRFPSREIPSHWTVCFMVDDCAETCDKVAELGGVVARKPMAVSAGWYARVADPHGAHFAVIELSDELRVD